MARVTVEDCILQVPNRFDLVMLASQRARDVSAGASILVDRDRDKNPVVALREIAETKLDHTVLRDALISSMQKHADIDKPEEVNEMPNSSRSWRQRWPRAAPKPPSPRPCRWPRKTTSPNKAPMRS